MYEFSHEQKKKLDLSYQVNLGYFFLTAWNTDTRMFAIWNLGAHPFWLYRQTLKDKRPWVGLNHQPFGILS